MGTSKKYDFASVGDRQEDLDALSSKTSADRQQLPIGIVVPVSLGSNGSLLSMHTDIEKNIADNFRNMIMTNFGERVGLYDFGGNLKSIAFDLGTDTFDEEAIRRIRRTTDKYMPFISLQTFEPLIERNDNKEVAKVGVRITYRVSSVSPNDRVIEVIIFTAG